jgi:hypothetical protein
MTSESDARPKDVVILFIAGYTWCVLTDRRGYMALTVSLDSLDQPLSEERCPGTPVGPAEVSHLKSAVF